MDDTRVSIRFISLSSSSQHGNAYLLEGPKGTRILIDCGIRLRRMEKILGELGIDPHTIQGIFLTHEHQDHTMSLKLRIPFPQRYGIPVYATPDFWSVIKKSIGCLDVNLCRRVPRSGILRVGEFYISSLVKPHDAVDPISYIVRTKNTQVGVVTDLGWVPDTLVEQLQGSEYLIFESNYDPEMEMNSGRDYHLVHRVMGNQGHLSNHQAGKALAQIVTRNTRGVLLAHLSLDCNRPELAQKVVSQELRTVNYNGFLKVAPGDGPSEWNGLLGS
jgi:phosphoribosyl 1,2-cyclic phosphodiesterase